MGKVRVVSKNNQVSVKVKSTKGEQLQKQKLKDFCLFI